MKKKALLIVIVLVVIALISYFFIYPKFNNHADDTKNCKISMNNNSFNYENKFESIFAKLNEFEQKNLEDNTLLNH